MQEILIIPILFVVGVASLIGLRVLFASQHRHAGGQAPPLFFCLWLVSTAVFNTFFLSVRIPGVFDMSIERALFLGMAASGVMRIYRNQLDTKADHSLEGWMILFIGILLVSMVIFGFGSTHPTYPKPWFIFFSGYFVPFWAFLYAKYILRDPKSIRMVLGTLFILGIYLCLTAFMERSPLRPFVFPHFIIDPRVTLHLDRARGPFLNSAFNGLAMNIGFTAGIFLLMGARGGKRALLLALLALYFPGIYLTYTRSVYMGFVIVLGTVLFIFRSKSAKWKLMPLAMAGVLVFVALNLERLTSSERAGGGLAQMEEVTIRFKLVERSLRLVANNALTGVGLGKFMEAESAPEIFSEMQHNHLLGLAVELGIFGLLVYCIILGHVFRRLYRLASDPRTDTLEATNVLLLFILMFSLNLFNNTFVEPAFAIFVNANTFTFAGLIDRFYEDPALLTELAQA